MDRQLKAISLVAACIALIGLPIASGRVDLAVEAFLILAVLLAVAFAVKGVRTQREMLRGNIVDTGAIKRALPILDEVLAAVVTPVLGTATDRSIHHDSVSAVSLLAQHGFASIPIPQTDVEVKARLAVLCHDAHFMSLIRSNAARVARRWSEFEMSHAQRLPIVTELTQHLRALESAVSLEDLSDILWPTIQEILDIRQRLSQHLGPDK